MAAAAGDCVHCGWYPSRRGVTRASQARVRGCPVAEFEELVSQGMPKLPGEHFSLHDLFIVVTPPPPQH